MPQTLFLGCVVLIACATLVASFVRWPIWGIGLYTAVQLWQLQRGMRLPLLSIGLDLLPSDVLTVCLLVAALVVFGKGRGRRAPAPLFLLLALTAYALFRGFGLFGVLSAGNEARTSFIQLFCIAFSVAVLSPHPILLRAVTRIWVAAACALSCLALLWWLNVGIGSSSDRIMVDGVLTNARPMGAAEALIISQAAVMLLCGHSFVGARVLAWPLMVVVVLAQHRTVWLAAGVMVTGWLLSCRRKTGSRAAGLAVLGFLSTLFLLAITSGAGVRITSSLAASSEDDRTLLWRMDGWKVLLRQLHDVPDWLLGLPFGSGYNRMVNGTLVIVSPHNYYLEVLLRLGLVGVAALLLLYVTAWRAAGADHDARLMLRLLICGQLVFAVTYALSPDQAVILGLLAACAQQRSVPRPHTNQESPCPTKPRSSLASPARTAHI